MIPTLPQTSRSKKPSSANKPKTDHRQIPFVTSALLKWNNCQILFFTLAGVDSRVIVSPQTLVDAGSSRVGTAADWGWEAARSPLRSPTPPAAPPACLPGNIFYCQTISTWLPGNLFNCQTISTCPFRQSQFCSANKKPTVGKKVNTKHNMIFQMVSSQQAKPISIIALVEYVSFWYKKWFSSVSQLHQVGQRYELRHLVILNSNQLAVKMSVWPKIL